MCRRPARRFPRWKRLVKYSDPGWKRPERAIPLVISKMKKACEIQRSRMKKACESYTFSGELITLPLTRKLKQGPKSGWNGTNNVWFFFEIWKTRCRHMSMDNKIKWISCTIRWRTSYPACFSICLHAASRQRLIIVFFAFDTCTEGFLFLFFHPAQGSGKFFLAFWTFDFFLPEYDFYHHYKS